MRFARFTCVALAALSWCACSSGKSAGETCTVGGDCKKGLFCCSGACVDPASDLQNCGSCGNLCGTAHAAPHCSMGVCSLTCASGFGDCDGDPKTGCEADLKSTASHCGSCATTCMAPNTPGACRNGACVTGQCSAGFGDCNNALGDGCETDLKSSLDHCGRCDTSCHPAHGDGVCAAGKCMVTGCDAGFANCNTLPGDGCEVDTLTDDSNCGACGNVCPTGHCVRGACRSPDLIVFGGQDSIYSSTTTAAVSRFTLDGHQWRALDAGGAVPPGRYAHAAAYDSTADRMLVWGGFTIDNYNYDNAPPDLYALEFSGQAPVWKKLATDGGPPPGRGSFAYAWDDANRTLWIYGGQDNYSGQTFGDFWSLDVPSLTWTQHEDGGMGGRSSAVMFLDPLAGGVVVGTGVNYNYQAFADYWLWLPDAGWATLPPDGAAPSVRYQSLSMADLLYGGVNPNSGALLSDLYQVQFTDAGIAFQPLSGFGGPVPKQRYYAAACSSMGQGYLLLGAVYQNYNYLDSSEVWMFDPDAGWFLENDGDGGAYFVDGDAGVDDDAGSLLQGPPGIVRASCVSRQ